MTPTWSTDISAAPRGKRVTVRKIGKAGKVNASTRMERELVWLASKCGKVILSEWLWPKQDGQTMTKARWMMLGMDEQPLAWRPFIEGEFPKVMVGKEPTWPNGKGPEYPAMGLGVAA
jgi:hypothetical protein